MNLVNVCKQCGEEIKYNQAFITHLVKRHGIREFPSFVKERYITTETENDLRTIIGTRRSRTAPSQMMNVTEQRWQQELLRRDYFKKQKPKPLFPLLARVCPYHCSTNIRSLSEERFRKHIEMHKWEIAHGIPIK